MAILEPGSGWDPAGPEALESRPAHGHDVLPSSAGRVVVHHEDQILHPVPRYVARRQGLDPAHVAQDEPDEILPTRGDIFEGGQVEAGRVAAAPRRRVQDQSGAVPGRLEHRAERQGPAIRRARQLEHITQQSADEGHIVGALPPAA